MKILKCYKSAAVSFSPDAYRLGGVKIGFWLTGKLGRAWVDAWCGAWHGAWCGAWHDRKILVCFSNH